MSLTPVSREHLRSLKKNKDEEMRVNQINNYVRNIYSAAVYKAETTTDTYYRYAQIDDFTRKDMPEILDFTRKNMPEILDTLKTLFPDCSVEYQNTIGGNDGKMYDINKLDESMRHILLNPSHNMKMHQQIVIEWS